MPYAFLPVQPSSLFLFSLLNRFCNTPIILPDCRCAPLSLLVSSFSPVSPLKPDLQMPWDDSVSIQAPGVAFHYWLPGCPLHSNSVLFGSLDPCLASFFFLYSVFTCFNFYTSSLSLHFSHQPMKVENSSFLDPSRGFRQSCEKNIAVPVSATGEKLASGPIVPSHGEIPVILRCLKRGIHSWSPCHWINAGAGTRTRTGCWSEQLYRT